MTYSIFHSTRALQTFLEAIVLLALIVAWRYRGLGREFFMSAEGMFGRLALNRRRAIAVAAALPMLVRLVLLPFFPIPQPRVHDEFSYLLLGDTLAHGRLANPTPPYWQHFETEYELVRPAYASEYEPGQGIVLAMGKVVGGNAWWGVWLSAGVMFGTLCWALQFALPPRWALFGTILAALQFGIFGFWMNSYYGGAVAATGGALCFGSLMRRRAISSAFIGALGVLIVLASRPVEGAIWLGAVACMMLWKGYPKRLLAPFLFVVAAGMGALGYYNAHITGSVFQPPYALYRQEYGTPQSYWWQPPVLIGHFDHPELAANYKDQLRHWERRYSMPALWDSTWRRLRDFWRFFIGPFLTPAFLCAALATRRRLLRPWLWVSAAFILEHATYHAWYPQQSASETVLIVLLVAEGWRHVRAWHAPRGLGLSISRNLAAGFAFSSVLLFVGITLKPLLPVSWIPVRRIWDGMMSEPWARAAVIRRLESLPGKHLVFVHYSAAHPWYDEWVFNGADIPGSRIVFARMCSPNSDIALARAMSDRDVWIAEPDKGGSLARFDQSRLLLASNAH